MKNEVTNSVLKSQTLSLSVVAAVNDDEVLEKNLAASPMFRDGDISLIVERGHKSASIAYNVGISKANSDIVVFAHQDVFLPKNWDKKLFEAIDCLHEMGCEWGVLGVVGKDFEGRLIGRSWSTGLRSEITSDFTSLSPVVSFDEIVLVLRKEAGLSFDEGLPCFHLYGTDIVQTAIDKGLGAYVFDGPVIHNSVRILKLGKGYTRAYKYLQRKWSEKLPISTCIMPLTKYGRPLLSRRLREYKRSFFEQYQRRPRHDEPSRLAKELEY